MAKSREFRLKLGEGSVAAIYDTPPAPKYGLTLAHGAGAGMTHEFMSTLAAGLVQAGFAVLRFQFPYMDAGTKRPDRPAVATATVAAAVDWLREELGQSVPVFAGGKSFGARMTTTAASQGSLIGARGIVAFGFPLHAAGEPSVQRAKHLEQVDVPLLCLQGTRDALADLDLMRKVCAKLKAARLHIVEGADHGFGVLKRSGRTVDEVFGELVAETTRFCADVDD